MEAFQTQNLINFQELRATTMKRLFPSSRQTFKACRGLAQVFHHVSPVVLYVEETFICFVRLLRPRDTRSGISPVKEVD